MLKKLGLSKALFVLVMVFTAISVIISGLIILRWQSQGEQSAAATAHIIKELEHLSHIQESMAELQSYFPELLIEKDIDALEKKLEAVQGHQKDLTETVSNCPFDCTEIKKVADLSNELMNKSVNEQILVGKSAEAIEFFIQKISPENLRLALLVKEKAATEKEALNKEMDEIKEQRQSEILKVLALIGLCIVVMLWSGYYLKKVLVETLDHVATKLDHTAVKVQTSSSEMSDASQKLAASTQQQSAALHETSSAAAEISATVEKNADSINESYSESKASVERIEAGKKSIVEMLEAISQISSANQKSVQEMKESAEEYNRIVGMIEGIAEKTKVINDIVFQTKLLSFNASVEAARAGEQGKGFAVVAEEVGNLASMSGNAAREITELLDSSRTRVREIAERARTNSEVLVRMGQSALIAGEQKAKDCDLAFDGISHDAAKVQSILQGISISLNEQSKGISEVNRAIAQLEEQTTSNTKISAESARFSQDLNSEASELKNAIEDLNRVILGS
jgi:methyl-accepting chemotaxis protein